MRLLLLLAALAVLSSLVACGNNRMRSNWHDARDVINKPFK